MVFASEFAASGWVSVRVLASGRYRYACSVNAILITYDLVVLSESLKNHLVDVLPNAGSHPFVKATPACHAMPPPQPSSRGRYSHGIPVFRTNIIPVIAARSSIRGRPLLGDR